MMIDEVEDVRNARLSNQATPEAMGFGDKKKRKEYFLFFSVLTLSIRI